MVEIFSNMVAVPQGVESRDGYSFLEFMKVLDMKEIQPAVH